MCVKKLDLWPTYGERKGLQNKRTIYHILEDNTFALLFYSIFILLPQPRGLGLRETTARLVLRREGLQSGKRSPCKWEEWHIQRLIARLLGVTCQVANWAFGLLYFHLLFTSPYNGQTIHNSCGLYHTTMSSIDHKEKANKLKLELKPSLYGSHLKYMTNFIWKKNSHIYMWPIRN